jgi:hypothetical protein
MRGGCVTGYQIFWEVVGLERGPLSLVSTIEALLGRKSSDCGVESREYGRRDPSRWPRGTLYPQKLALTSPTSGGRSVGIVRSRRPRSLVFFFSLYEIKTALGWTYISHCGREVSNFSYYSTLPSYPMLTLIAINNFYSPNLLYSDRLCGLVVRVLGYRSGGTGSIPGTTRKKM